MQVAQGRAGVDAQLVAEQVAHQDEAAQGLGLPPGAVEGQHQLAPPAFPERLGGGQRLGHGGRAVAAAGGQLGVEPVLLGRPAGLLEAGDLGAGEAVAGDVGQGRPAPDGEGGLQGVRGQRRLVAGQLGAAGGGERLEPFGVELAGVQLEHVPRRPRLQRRRRDPEPVAQRRHVDLEGMAGRGRRGRPPQAVDQVAGRDDQPGVDGQRRQQRPLQAAADPGRRPVPASQLDRAQEPDLGERRRRSLAHAVTLPRLERALRSSADSSPCARRTTGEGVACMGRGSWWWGPGWPGWRWPGRWAGPGSRPS